MRAHDRRKLLTQAALQVMKRDGVVAASTRAICAEAGMPHGAFHYCFRSKQELYAELLSADIDVELDDAWAKIDADGDIRASIQALLEAYWCTVEADPALQIVLTELTTLALREPSLRELPEWEQRAYRARITGHLERFAERAGVDYSIPIRTLTEMILAALSGVTTAWLSSRDDETARTTIAEFAGVFAAYARRGEQALDGHPEMTTSDNSAREGNLDASDVASSPHAR